MTTEAITAENWWIVKSDSTLRTPDLNKLAACAMYMVEAHYEADDIAYMIEKPWKFLDEYLASLDNNEPGV